MNEAWKVSWRSYGRSSPIFTTGNREKEQTPLVNRKNQRNNAQVKSAAHCGFSSKTIGYDKLQLLSFIGNFEDLSALINFLFPNAEWINSSYIKFHFKRLVHLCFSLVPSNLPETSYVNDLDIGEWKLHQKFYTSISRNSYQFLQKITEERKPRKYVARVRSNHRTICLQSMQQLT